VTDVSAQQFDAAIVTCTQSGQSCFRRVRRGS
jgi:hypothetical protein